MFFFISDFGFFNEKLIHLTLNRNVNKLSEKINTSHKNKLLLGGDNFYSLGIKDTDDIKLNHFASTFNSKIHSSKIYATLGNHDYSGNVIPQYETKYFNMTKDFYKIETNDITVFMVDTTLIDFTTFTSIVDVYRNVFPEKFDIIHKQHCEDMKEPKYNTQLEWRKIQDYMKDELFCYRKTMLLRLDNELGETRILNPDNYIVVVGHYPLHTYGKYIRNISNSTLMHLAPILMTHQIELYICGHDHTNQHLSLPYNYIETLISMQSYKEEDDKSFVYSTMNCFKKHKKKEKKINIIVCGTFMDIFQLPFNMSEYEYIETIGVNETEETYIKFIDMKRNSYVTFERNEENKLNVCFNSISNNEIIYEILI